MLDNIENYRFDDIVRLQYRQAIRSFEAKKQYSLESLTKLHAYTFQDTYESTEISDQFLEFNSGVYRCEKDEYNAHMKIRTKDNEGIDSLSTYSRMTEKDINHLQEVLEQNQPEYLQELPFSERIDKLVTIYKEIDFTHPFSDGNSRTARAYIESLAYSVNVELKWKDIDRKDWYIGRDYYLGVMSIQRMGDSLDKIQFTQDVSVKQALELNQQQLSRKYSETTLTNLIRQNAKNRQKITE